MNIEGWAMKASEEELRAAKNARYEEIKHLSKELEIKKNPAYGKGIFAGVLKSEEATALSEKDLALIADHGNLCFGGYCTKSSESFSGAYYTD